ncbi:OprD family outer membrane porin [Pseudomonas sp. AMR01]|uniref:OprD family outer membrane porin n=1 Tax=Pseudomonas sp. AMR01 TaxID=3064904 RepID=UPI0035C1582D
MLSTQRQAASPVRFSRLAKTTFASATALSGFSPMSQAAFFEDITLNNRNSRFLSGATGKHFNFGGADYKFADKITASYHFAQLDDVYRQFSHGLNGHKLSAGYQRMFGDSAFPYVDGSDPCLVNFVQINDFAGATPRTAPTIQRVMQMRYAYSSATASHCGKCTQASSNS